MLLRSSSAPLVRTHFSTRARNHSTASLSAAHGGRPPHLSRSSFSLNTSPISTSASESSGFNWKTNNLSPKSGRRARHDGNLEGLGSISSDMDEFHSSETVIRSSHKQGKSMLHTEPSFCIYTSTDGFDEGNERENLVTSDVGLERSGTIGEKIEDMGSDEFSFRKKSMGSIEESGVEEEEEEEEGLRRFQDLGIEEAVEPGSPPMYLATGLGIGGGISGGGDFSPVGFGEGGDVDEYYKRMVGEDPSNPLFLRNYAQLLQSKGDLRGAEDYLFRATIADPKDSEICSSYAKLVWELHRDQDRALNYFEQAARAAPQDSHVLGAYASFLWEIEEDEEEDCAQNGHIESKEEKCLVDGHVPKTAFEATDSGKGETIEEYYKRMVEEKPRNALFLRNYAKFLYQSKGDCPGAEEYYSRAILADPSDGEIISQYAKLVWELHHDQAKAVSYFKRAIQATPEDSNVLAAYASFLWEIEDDEEEDGSGEDNTRAPVLEAMTFANA